VLKIYIIRHGQTDWNVQRRLQGHTDIPLNNHGRQQAKALQEVLLPLSIEAFYSSDLSRAIVTAELARAHAAIPIIQDAGLREAALGEAEGLFFDDLHLRFPDAYTRWLSTGKPNEDFAFSGGESKLQHRARLEETLKKLFITHPYSRVAIVTHGGAMRRILELCENFVETEFRTANTSVYELEFSPHEQKLSFLKKLYSP
jgi:probable phosphoglycerate mutase